MPARWRAHHSRRFEMATINPEPQTISGMSVVIEHVAPFPDHLDKPLEKAITRQLEIMKEKNLVDEDAAHVLVSPLLNPYSEYRTVCLRFWQVPDKPDMSTARMALWENYRILHGKRGTPYLSVIPAKGASKHVDPYGICGKTGGPFPPFLLHGESWSTHPDVPKYEDVNVFLPSGPGWDAASLTEYVRERTSRQQTPVP